MSEQHADDVEALERQIDALKQRLSEARRLAEPEPVGEYEFKDVQGCPISLRSLFAGRRDLLVIHNMGRRCVYCTLWADGFDGLLKPLTDRAAFVLASPDEPAVMREFAHSRGWKMTMVSEAGISFRADMGFEPKPGRHMPGVSAFRLGDDGTILRTGRASFGPLDDFCPVWPLFDLLKGGAGGWEPKYEYPGA